MTAVLPGARSRKFLAGFTSRWGTLRASPGRVFAAQGVVVALAVVFFGSYRFDAAAFDPGNGGPLLVQDRHGVLLRSVPAQDGRPGRAAWVPLSDVSSSAVLTLLASEDRDFFDHYGVDFRSLVRAAWLTATTEKRYGGSTLTMQLARMVHSQGKPRTVWRKLLEMRAAWGIERNLSKQQILEQYLNRAYYGHGAYGIEAAARLYFNKPAASLSVGEATFLSVIPRGPSFYDPYRHRERLLARRKHLFSLLVEQGRMTQQQVNRAEREPLRVGRMTPVFRAPHFVDWVLRELPEEHLHAGGVLQTSLDLQLQEALERRTADYIRSRRADGIRQAGVVVLDAESAEVLAMVGSPDYHDADAGSLNITTRRRFPGSALKPFLYATAIEEGASPASIAFDVRDISSTYRDTAAKEHGPVPYREALAGSYNFAAIHVIEQLGIVPMMRTLQKAGVSPLQQAPDAYGSRLALGSTKVRLLDLAAGYRSFVHEGYVRAPSGVRRLVRGDGGRWLAPNGEEVPVFTEQTAWLAMDMLSDPEARRPMFGDELPVDLPYRVVAKTGTAEGFADTVAVLATREYLVGVWAGRFDGAATQGQAGMAAAAPLARAALLLASDGRRLTLPPVPVGLTRASVCPFSGLRPGPHCPRVRREHFHESTVPEQTCQQHPHPGRVHYPEAVRRWAQERGLLRSPS